VRRLAVWAALTVALASGPAMVGAAEAQRSVAAGTLALRMSESMGWPDRFTAVVRVEPVTTSTGSTGVAFRLEAFTPDTFRWTPLDPRGVGGTAWRGYLLLDTTGPGPRFSYGYDGFPFLRALEVYFSVFRPQPEGSRLVLGQGVRLLNRSAVEAVLYDTAAGQQAHLVIDAETGLVLQASVLPPGSSQDGGTPLVSAVRFDVGAAVAAVEYEAPVLGDGGRMVLSRRGRVWFLSEAVVHDGSQAYRVRLEQVRLGDEAGPLTRPDVSTLQRLAGALERARQAVEERRWEDAMAAAREALGLDPYNIQAHNLLGYAAMERGDWVTAASAFDQIIHLAPDSPLGYNNLAYLYADEGFHLSRALSLARRAMELSGDEPDASVLDTYGWALYRNGRIDEARQVLERAVAASGDDPRGQAEILYHLGVVLIRMERVDEARRLLGRAVELDPELDEAREALSLLEQGKPDMIGLPGARTGGRGAAA